MNYYDKRDYIIKTIEDKLNPMEIDYLVKDIQSYFNINPQCKNCNHPIGGDLLMCKECQRRNINGSY